MKKFLPEIITKRLAHLPRPTYAEDLTVNTRREEIKLAIEQHRVVIICGETGSGKTTQIPKICLELKRGVHGLIGHTQPRRIAAELSSPLGQAVGYKVRFTDKISLDSYIKLMTDGILLAETQGDPRITRYDLQCGSGICAKGIWLDFRKMRLNISVIVLKTGLNPWEKRIAKH